MHIMQLPVGDMGVNLGCGDIFVSQHFLNRTDVSTIS
jgi:hypothetical protein